MINYEHVDITYKEFIDNICNTRGQHNVDKNKYYEMHHIVPVCLGGTGDTKTKKFKKNSTHPNCIYLTPKEHYIAHYLLYNENKDNIKLARAFICMRGMNHMTGILYEDAEIYDKTRTSACSAMSTISKDMASKTSKEERIRRAKCGGQGNKQRLTDPVANQEWRKICHDIHKNRSIEEEQAIYVKVSASLSDYYSKVDRNSIEWKKLQENNKQKNIEAAKAWRSKFFELFGTTPESFRKFGLMGTALKLFKDIKNEPLDKQLEEINKFKSKIEEIV